MANLAIKRLLKSSRLKPTEKRMALAAILFDGDDKHVTAESLLRSARLSKISVSQATVYNTLNQFCNVGLLRRIAIDGSCSFFDTNVTPHHHIYYEDERRLVDVSAERLTVDGMPHLPSANTIRSVEVLIRVSGPETP